MAPLDMPHHMRAHDRSLPYREGVTLRPAAAASPADAPSAADVGLRAPVRLDRTLVPGVRVTVRMPTAVGTHARVVAPSEPREAQVRRARVRAVRPPSPDLSAPMFFGRMHLFFWNFHWAFFARF